MLVSTFHSADKGTTSRHSEYYAFITKLVSKLEALFCSDQRMTLSNETICYRQLDSRARCGNSFICPTRSGTTEIYIFGPAGAGIQNKICNIHLIDIVLQVQKYLEVQVFLVLQKYLEYQKQWNCSKLSERDTDMQNNIVKLRQRVRQG